MSKASYLKKEDALLLIAFASLKHWQESIDIENILAEKARIERVISDEYVKSTTYKEYNQFVLDFIKKYGREIVYTNIYNYDIEFPDEHYELNVDTIINKYNLKKSKENEKGNIFSNNF